MLGRDIRDFVVRPVLKAMAESTGIKLYSRAAENLVLGTIATETGGRYLRQIKGPARGICQMEYPTYKWVMRTLEDKYFVLHTTVLSFCSGHWSPWQQLDGNLFLSVALCRARYFLDPDPLPRADDLSALGAYYKRVWNTKAGKGSVEKFVKDFLEFADWLS